MLRAVNERLDHVPGEVLVKFPRRDRCGGAVVDHGPGAGAGWRPTDPVGRRARRGEHRFGGAGGGDRGPPGPRAGGRVRAAEPLRAADRPPNDPGLSQQWNLDTVDVPRAWDINPGGADVLVAVIDSGVTTATANVVYRLWTGQRFENVVVALPREPGPRRGAHRHAHRHDLHPSGHPGAGNPSRSSTPRATAPTSPAPSFSPPTTTWDSPASPTPRGCCR